MAGLYFLALKRLQKLRDPRNIDNRIIRFPVVFESLCRSFQIPKDECWEVLFLLRDFGFIEVVRYQGIRIDRKMCSKVGI